MNTDNDLLHLNEITNNVDKCQVKSHQGNKKISHEDFIKKLSLINNDILILGKYINAQTKVKCRCKLCGYEWETKPNHLISGHGCPKCCRKTNNNKNKSSDELKEDIYNRRKDIIIIDDFINQSDDFMCECINCKSRFSINYPTIMRATRHFICKKCNDKTIINNRFNSSKNAMYEIAHQNNITIINADDIDNIKCRCNKCNNIWSMKFWSIIRHKKIGCRYCSNINFKSDSQFRKEVLRINSEVEILSEYINRKTLITCKCKCCGHIWETYPSSLLNNSKCPNCTKQKMRNLFGLSNDDFKKRIDKKYNGEYEVISDYVNVRTPVKLMHKQCGSAFMYSPNLLYEDRKNICPICFKNRQSRGEYVIENYLSLNNILFEDYKKFDDLLGINNGKLSYDFYLPDGNILIEFNGIQHYAPVDIFGGYEQFSIQQEHDKRKYEYAKDNKIKLIVIPYWEFNNIEKILSKELTKVA